MMDPLRRLQNSTAAAKFLFKPSLGFVEETSIVSYSSPRGPPCSPRILDVELRKQHFHLRSGNLDIQLLLPDTSSLLLSATYSVTSIPTSNPDLFQHYVAFRQSAEPWLYPSEAAATKKCTTEIQSIAQLIPNTHDPIYVLCLAANLFWLCAMDDLVESVRASDALDVLRSAQTIFLPHTDSATSTVPLSASLTDVASPLSRADHMSTAYLHFLATHLPLTQLDSCRTTIVETLHDLLQETQLRQDPHPTVEAYLVARKLSMAEAPFWFLSQGPAARRPMSQTSPALGKLMDLVALATGMQNDLLGLQKDLSTGDEMNYVLVAARQGGEERLDDITTPDQVWTHLESGVALHDASIREALECWSDIKRDEKGSQDEWDLADTLLIVLERHARWVATNKRYDFA